MHICTKMKVEVTKRGCRRGRGVRVRAWKHRSTQKFAGQPGQSLINPVKISTPRVCTGFAGKEIGQNYLCKVQESDQVKLAIIQIKLWVKAAVIANVVVFFKKKLGIDSGRCKLLPPKSSALWR